MEPVLELPDVRAQVMDEFAEAIGRIAGLGRVDLVPQVPPEQHTAAAPALDDEREARGQGGFEHDGERILQPLHLSGEEKADLVAFLKSLTSPEDKAKHAPYH